MNLDHISFTNEGFIGERSVYPFHEMSDIQFSVEWFANKVLTR